jgi:type III secretory pathway lipoprotein EscJ
MTRLGVCLLFLFLVGCQEKILHDLSEAEGNRLITKLHEIGIAAEKKVQPDGTWALAVQKDDVLKALSALSDARVFRRAGGDYRERGESMLPSRDAQRFQFERAVAQEIELTLSALGGVLESRVHLHLPPSDPLFGRKITDGSSTSASVLLITEESFAEDVEQIKDLVSAAAGVNREKVSILVSGAQLEVSPKQPASEKPQLLAATVRRNHVRESEGKEGSPPSLEQEVQQVPIREGEEREMRASLAAEKALLVEAESDLEFSPVSAAGGPQIAEQDKGRAISTPTSLNLWWGITALFLLLLGLGACSVARKLRPRSSPRTVPTQEGSSFERHLQSITLNEGSQ